MRPINTPSCYQKIIRDTMTNEQEENNDLADARGTLPTGDSEPTDKIRDMEIEALTLAHALNDASEVAKDRENAVISAVEKEYELTGNKSLSNATKRMGEVDSILSLNQEYLALGVLKKSLGNKISALNIEISYEKRQFKRDTGNTKDIQDIRDALKSIAGDTRMFLKSTIMG